MRKRKVQESKGRGRVTVDDEGRRQEDKLHSGTSGGEGEEKDSKCM